MTTFAGHILTGTTAARPAASAVPAGTLYSSTTDGVVYQSSGSAWGTWLAAPTAGVPIGVVDVKGDLIAASGPDAVARLPVGSNNQVLTADSAQTLGVKWATPAAAPTRIVELKVVDDATAVATGDGKLVFAVPSGLDGLNLTDADAYVTTVSSSGLPTVQIRNVTDAVDMLTTRITIDASETTSYTAATQPVIDTAHDDVTTGDLLAVDVDVAGTGAKGLGVILVFS